MFFRPVARSLEESDSYDPAWRALTAADYARQAVIDGILELPDPTQELLANEEDTLIREYFLWQRTGSSQNDEVMRYAHVSKMDNGRSIPRGAIIKAMCIAGYSSREIATLLQTRIENIEVFLKLYFDVDRYLENRTWLASVVEKENAIPGAPPMPTTADQMVMKYALNSGKDGLAAVLSNYHEIAPAIRDEFRRKAQALFKECLARLRTTGSWSGNETAGLTPQHRRPVVSRRTRKTPEAGLQRRPKACAVD